MNETDIHENDEKPLGCTGFISARGAALHAYATGCLSPIILQRDGDFGWCNSRKHVDRIMAKDNSITEIEYVE